MSTPHRCIRLAGEAPLVLLTAFLLVACATTSPPREEIAPYWPEPPDRPRFQYELSLRSDLSIAEPEEKTRFEQLVAGKRRRASVTLTKPFDVAARGGKIIVSDTVARVVYLFDIPRRQLFAFGTRGEGALTKPLGVDIDNDLNLYVADATDRRVCVYDPNGHHRRCMGGAEELERPTDVAVTGDGSRVFVVDAGGVDSTNHRVVVYDAQGRRLFAIGGRGVTPGRFNLPTHAAVAPDGTLYVLDAGNFRVQAFDQDGRFVRAWGSVGTGFGQFARPRGIAVDDDGNVYVTDARFGNVQIFNAEGSLLLALGQAARSEDKPGRYMLLSGVAVDETGRVYLVDQGFKKVDVIRPLSEAQARRILERFRM